ncbi:MAG TPA: LysM peptidoglycan-binding domain-containing protein [Candidatus Dormibacteraeota bacterium]|nr:LysM peptidoglycan-binding domain-containing protein [Candidatus Dormibacteraeota bacterium]
MKPEFLSPSFLKKTKRNLRRFFKKPIIRNSILSIVLVFALVFIGAITYRSSSSNLNDQAVVQVNSSTNTINPLSTVSTSAIAYQVASMTGIYESIPAANQAQSQAASQDIPLNDQLIAEPIILATSVKTRADIIAHKVVAGDSLSSLAIAYGVTSQSISESNGINYGYLKLGSTIYIPPINGIVYVVKAGDTPQNLANAYNANANDIVSFNDAEISGLKVGERIVIPNGSVAQTGLNYYGGYSPSYYSFAFGTSAIYGYNGYDFGWCTWWVAHRRATAGNPIPANLGNAYSWLQLAQDAHIPTGLTPQPGSIIWFGYGADHVAYVEAVNSDGSLLISEMMAFGYLKSNLTIPGGGWDIVDYRIIPANQVHNYRYIY